MANAAVVPSSSRAASDDNELSYEEADDDEASAQTLLSLVTYYLLGSWGSGSWCLFWSTITVAVLALKFRDNDTEWSTELLYPPYSKTTIEPSKCEVVGQSGSGVDIEWKCTSQTHTHTLRGDGW